jgi:glycosyltransferase involved in cell wall biosynthesis
MISVVVPAYNEAESIGPLLESLAVQSTRRTFEVIVVDNASTDTTSAVAKSYADRLVLKVLLELKRGRGAARAAGFAAAEGDIVLCTDADTVVPPNWVESLASELEKSGAVAITGTCRIEDCSPYANYVYNLLQPWHMRAHRWTFGHYFPIGSNCAIKKEAYIKAGGFSTDASDLEDVQIGFRLSRIGRISMITSVPVTTSGRRFQHGLIKGLLPYGAVFFKRFFLRQTSANRD